MAKEIDFSRLTLQDALDLAILIEDEAEERYQEFARQMDVHHSEEPARFFRFMASNEAKHGQELRGSRKARFADAPSRVDRSQLWDIEAPVYDTARAFMSAREAMEVALASETKAHDYFAEAQKHVTDADVARLFEELRLEEVEHQKMVREQLEKLPPGPDLPADDFVDEPKGQ